ncbi:Hypothetical predicted protein, partial [Pelobates cultripes]
MATPLGSTRVEPLLMAFDSTCTLLWAKLYERGTYHCSCWPTCGSPEPSCCSLPQ